MSETNKFTKGAYEPTRYEIRIKGHLDDRWADWFEHLTLIREDNGETLLTVSVVEQSALHGVLRKVRDLGLPLISVISIEPEPPEIER